ncbi:MAG: M20/M25/M40 family metallo-hydrolase [Candidatus Omnitrophica bacterium]|nr:M20/M25/M40 family metallo-hydrolase [Candidatus Omnitrophota bacterium]MCB9720473.1 M20/M25/M40 family metallo-hydrolase [Candidatus Omnitrophota bacterium]
MTKRQEDHVIEQRLVALTRDLMLIPSVPSRPMDRQRAFELIKNHLEVLDHIEIHEYEENGIPSLVARPKGVRKPKILMCGHIDVIEHEDPACYRSSIRDGRIYGPGGGDMKGSVAIILEVFRHMNSVMDKPSLALAITSDEETGGEFGLGYLVNKMGLRAHKAMIPDGGSLSEITVAEKGILHLKVTAQGQSAHSARPWLGMNPVEELMNKLTYLKSSFKVMQENHAAEDKWYPTCAVTRIGTENKQINRVPSEAYAVLDVRFPTPYTTRKIKRHIREMLGDKIAIEPIIGAEPTNLSPDPEYQRVIEEVTGKPTELVRDDGGSDARFLAAQGIPVMISRPRVGNLHAVDEWIDISSMVTFYHIYEKYLARALA